MELKVIDAKGQVSGSLAVSDALFAREYNEAWFTNWLLLTWQMPVLVIVLKKLVPK